ncbi:MAG: hypothetical protein Q8922_05140 [Bacteroidota bacterium]|nr:hypothetical protein [Bacteroidota bacterium]MDP4231914.1 hypothetical protein [Bacteroidota bacterium]MDP4241379.1 hypothetical protein [Bacteroidota bacterium]MDP4287302.1 hypothetical protein [Bacteroidota bacterium]
MKNILISFVLILGFVSVTQAQLGDTIQYRTLVSYLGDSTTFNYRIGEVGLLQSTTASYVGFVSGPWTAPEQDFLVSLPFTISGSTDTLSFYRTLNMDTKDVLETSVDMTVQGAQFDSVLAAWDTIMSSRVVHPDTSYFAVSSMLNYIVEIRRASDSSILLGLDTVRAYVNSLGNLRYSTTKNTPSHRVCSIGSIGTGTSVFLDVRLVTLLPIGSTLAHNAHLHALQDPTLVSPICGQYQDNCDPGAEKRSQLFNNTATGYSLSATTFDNTGGRLHVTIDCSVGGQVECDIVNVLGEIVAANVSTLSPGLSSFDFDVSKLQRGPYFLRLTDGITTTTNKIQL